MTWLVGGVVAVLVAVVTAWLTHRRMSRRLDAVARRLEREGADRTSPRSGTPISRLEHEVARAAERVTATEVARWRLAEVLATVAEGIVVCAEDGDVVFCNERASPYLQARHAEVLAERALSELLEQALEGRPSSRTVELYGPPRRSLLVRAAPLQNGSATSGAVALIDDVTERRRLEAVRRDFVANLSHELKTPVGALALLAETLVGDNDAEVNARLADRMLIEAQRVSRIIEDLLDLSRIESEESPLRDSVPVHLVLAEASERVRAAADARRITLDIEEPSPQLLLWGERRQLVSAVGNLLENAVRYSGDGSVVEVRVDADGPHVDLVVRDYGIGIPARDLERIFERFYRVDPARARDTGGTGLGLAIVRHVAQNHHGEVLVQSQEGRGSTFTLRLPADAGPVPARELEVS